MNLVSVVAIDGPAGSGKSTVARLVAARLGFTHVDTGAMYRALTLRIIKAGVGLDDETQIARAIAGAEIEFDGVEVFLDGVSVTADIRTAKVTKHVSQVSAYPTVRSALLTRQRSCAANDQAIVMEGRDIGTVVFPDARWKIYLDASPEVRAERRYNELVAGGSKVDLERVLYDIIERDRYDSQRITAPLKPAPGAVMVDTSRMNIEQVVDRIVAVVQSGAPTPAKARHA